MDTDIKIIKLEIKEGYEEEIKNICEVQASRDKPRKLISTLKIEDQIILMFELCN